MSEYETFLDDRAQANSGNGFAPLWMPPALFDFQAAMVDWSLRQGRAALFEDCGMGKALQGLVWAENVVRHTNGRVLVLTPLAVTGQMVREGEKFGIEARRTDKLGGAGIYVANYQRLHHYDPADFAGAVCDESSILKNFDGTTKAAVTEFMRRMSYRLLCTATAAPNDYVELGTSSEALGYLGHMDMLNRFFKNTQNTSDTKGHWQGHGMPRERMGPKWRFKGHAEQPFWRWCCSWARALRRPSDLGFDDARFVLPPLIERQHVVGTNKPRAGFLFAMDAHGLKEQRDERRHSLRERCEKAAALVAETNEPAVCWAHLNDEADLLEELVPGAVQVSGSDSDDEKEEKFLAFERREARVLVIKPAVGAYGLNWQHCNHMTTFAGYSFEQYYQSARRCWRYGQQRPVTIETIVSDAEGEVLASRQRKAAQADAMFDALVRYMRDGMHVARSSHGAINATVPSWM